MNLKKTAAAALGALGDRSSVRSIVGWIARHDNPGLRASLLASLDALQGKAADATLLAALGAAASAESRDLLLGALDGRLSLRSARAHREAPWFASLVARLQHDGFSLRDASSADIDDLLGRATTPPVDAAQTAQQTLVEGWFTHGLTAADVPHLLAARRAGKVAGARLFALARRDVAVLLQALDGAEAATRDGVVSLLHGAFSARDELDTLRPLAQAIDRLAAFPPGCDRVAHRELLQLVLPALDKEARWRLADRLRANPPAPERFGDAGLALLRACGRAITRDDVLAALAACGRSPDAEAVTRSVVQEALRVSLPDAPPALVQRVGEALRDDDATRALVPEGDDDPVAFIGAVAEHLPWLSPERRALALDAVTRVRPIDVPDWRGGPDRVVHVPPPLRERPVDPDALAPARRPALVRSMREGLRAVRTAPWVMPLWIDPAHDGDAWLAALALDLRDADARNDLAALGSVRQRLRYLAEAVGPSERRARVWRKLLPPLVEAWTVAPETIRHQVEALLRACPEAMRAALLAPAIAAGQWGLLALFSQAPVDAPLAALVRRAASEGYVGPTPVLTDGTLVGHAPTPAVGPPPVVLTRPDPRAVLDALESAPVEHVRSALKALARDGRDALLPYLDRALAVQRLQSWLLEHHCGPAPTLSLP